MGASSWRFGVAGCGLALWVWSASGLPVEAAKVTGQESGRSGAAPVAPLNDNAVRGVPPARHVKPSGRFLRQTADLLGEAERRSPTIRRMMATLDESDLVVYVSLESSLRNKTGALTFLRASGEARMVLISIGLWSFPDDRIKWLGHELAHALEVSEAPEVRDSASLAAHFGRIGRQSPEDRKRYETARAEDTGRQVEAELARRK